MFTVKSKSYISAFADLLLFLLTPEDSCTANGSAEMQIRYDRVKIRYAGDMKLFFWLIISVAAGIALAQL